MEDGMTKLVDELTAVAHERLAALAVAEMAALKANAECSLAKHDVDLLTLRLTERRY